MSPALRTATSDFLDFQVKEPLGTNALMLWPTLARGVKRAKTRAYGETIRVEVRKEYRKRKAAMYAPRASEMIMLE